MKFRHLRADVHFVKVGGKIIVLDIPCDQYHIFNADDSENFLAVLTKPVKTLSVSRRLENLLDPECFDHVDEKVGQEGLTPWLPRGMDSNSWRLRSQDIDAVGVRWLVSGMIALHRSHALLQSQGFAGLVKDLRAQRTRRARRFTESSAPVENLISALNLAALLFPRPTRCLPWAAAMAYLLRKHTLAAPNLIIGVQNAPFYAHAWVEINRAVVGDVPERREQLAVICTIEA